MSNSPAVQFPVFPLAPKAIPPSSALIFLTLALLNACSRSSGPPYSPQQALKTLKIEDGFQIALFANEPDVADPVAMDIDESGRIYVLENHGYPLDTTSAEGKVKLLEDTDGDGRPDRARVFADKLVMPTGVMAWKKGVIVTDPPDVLYFKDTDGDGKADIRKVVLTGFAFTNPQHTVSSPYYGLDNWIYLSHEGYARAVVFTDKFGDTGKEIYYAEKPDGPRVEVTRRSVRFRPDTLELELLAGPSQFGQTFDAWGHLFTHNNSNHAAHEVIAARYLERNPHLRVARTAQDMSDHGNAAQVYPITIKPRFEILTGVGVITSAAGLTFYQGGKFPAGFESVAFVAEPAHNLVHRDVWKPNGVSFTASRAIDKSEFLASTDSWFRPVNFYVGPDGALYILDYYREIIEHPEWTSSEIYQSEMLYDGKDRGRIYRVTPAGADLPFAGKIDLGAASDAELVAHLDNPNIWWRRTAQRLLVDRKSDASIEPLKRLALTGASAAGRLHALRTLDGIGKLDPALIEHSLGDPEAGVRENAVILAEPRLAGAPALTAKLLTMAGDASPGVKLQLLCTLGYVATPAARAIRDKLLFDHIDDPWMQIAALSWPSDDAGALFSKAAGPNGITAKQSEGRQRLFERLASIVGGEANRTRVAAILRTVLAASARQSVWWREASLRGLDDGLRGKDAAKVLGAPERSGLLRLAEGGDTLLRRAALRLIGTTGLASNAESQAAVQRAAAIAADAAQDAERRADAIALLALAGPKPYEAQLKALLVPGQPEPVELAAARAMGAIPGLEPARFLLANWRAMPPAVRAEAGDAMYTDQQRLEAFVGAIESGGVQPWMLTSQQRNRLIMHNDPAFRARARKLLAASEEERRQVVEKYQAALERPGDKVRGREVFERVCKKCHAMDGDGAEVGPDLATVSGRPASAIMGDILAPSQSIAQTYEAYVVETTDGRTIDGVMGPQSPTFVTLRREKDQEDVIERQNIKNMYASNISAMPSDLEKQVSVGQMADLLAFIKSR